MSKAKPTKTPRVPENDPLSPAEQQILDLMKSTYGTRLNSISENTLIRYIRGYKDDAAPSDKALEMLGKMLTWRETNHIEQVSKEKLPKSEIFKSIWPSGLHGVGKDGHPILINRVGQVDGAKLTKEFTMDEVTKFHIQEMESLDAHKESESKSRGRRVYKHIVILDLKGLGMGHLKERFTTPMKQFISIDQDNYPETLHVMIVVNAGMLMKAAWKIAGAFIDPITKENIKFGSEHLPTYIDAANLPKIYGGHCGCAGGKCLEVPFVSGDASAKIEIQPEPAAAGETIE